MSAPSYTYTLTNGTTADASQVMQDFNDILNGVTDGTKDLTFSALTANGAANLKAAVTLGASSANDLTVNGALASTIAIKTNNSFAVGSSTKGLSGIFFGNAGVGVTCQVLSASHATTRNYTIPDCGAAASFVMTQGTQTVVGATTFSGQLIGKGTATNDTASAGYIGEIYNPAAASNGVVATATVTNLVDGTNGLSAGDWEVWGTVYINTSTNGNNYFQMGISTTSGAFDGTNGESTALFPLYTNGGTTNVGSGSLRRRISLAGTGNVFLCAQMQSVQITGAYAKLYARRLR